MADEITVGGSCVSRGAWYGNLRTCIQEPNPANLRGILTRILIYPWHIPAYQYWVGVFYRTNANTFKCRSAQDIGSLSQPCQTVPLSPNLAIEEGDLIGFYGADSLAQVPRSPSSSTWFWASGNHCVVDDEATYTAVATGGIFSCQGRGDYEPSGEFGIVI